MSLIELLEKHPQFIVTSLSHRFEGRPDEHAYIFLSVPSNNVIEFKWYNDRRMIY